MKFKLIFLLSILTFSNYGQDIKTCNKNLEDAFLKFKFFANQRREENKDVFDSIEMYNKNFEKLLLKYTNSIPETLKNEYKNLTENGLKISTSQNKLFRIYSWDTETGGTMRGFKNVFQFMTNDKTFSKKLNEVVDEDIDEYGENNFTYEIIDQINIKNKTYYITKCIFIESSALSYQKIKIFSIEDAKLNDDAKLIKTKTGIKNELGYEIDFSANVNRSEDSIDREFSLIAYDKKNKIIILPLILENGKLTKKKIKYQFKGEYFEKI